MDGHDEHVPDKDWISRRWQGEGHVVRRDPVRKGEPPVKATREAGDMQFERGLGEHCTLCKRLDLLPLACQLCSQPYCASCIDVDVHCCPEKHAHQPRRVPDMSGWAKPGDRVQLEGLVKAAAHNGKEAVVQRASLQRGSSGHDRFVIRTSSGTELAVKPTNMRHLPQQLGLSQQENEVSTALPEAPLELQSTNTVSAETVPRPDIVRQTPPEPVTSYRTRDGVMVNSTLDFLVESNLSRYHEPVSTTSTSVTLSS